MERLSKLCLGAKVMISEKEQFNRQNCAAVRYFTELHDQTAAYFKVFNIV